MMVEKANSDRHQDAPRVRHNAQTWHDRLNEACRHLATDPAALAEVERRSF